MSGRCDSREANRSGGYGGRGDDGASRGYSRRDGGGRDDRPRGCDEPRADRGPRDTHRRDGNERRRDYGDEDASVADRRAGRRAVDARRDEDRYHRDSRRDQDERNNTGDRADRGDRGDRGDRSDRSDRGDRSSRHDRRDCQEDRDGGSRHARQGRNETKDAFGADRYNDPRGDTQESRTRDRTPRRSAPRDADGSAPPAAASGSRKRGWDDDGGSLALAIPSDAGAPPPDLPEWLKDQFAPPPDQLMLAMPPMGALTGPGANLPAFPSPGIPGMPTPTLAQDNAVQVAVAHAIMPILAKEEEWDAAKLQTKIVEYLWKAAKACAPVGMPWNKMVQEFTDKFINSLWKALGDRIWIDEIMCADVVANGIISYCQPPEVSDGRVPPEVFRQSVEKATEHFADNQRYYSWGWDIMKRLFTEKNAKKKVTNAVDTARELVIKQSPGDAEQFMAMWIKQTVDEMSCTGNNWCEALPPATAVRLFCEMIKEGGGLPVILMKAAGIFKGTPPELFATNFAVLTKTIGSSIQEAYSKNQRAPAPSKSSGGNCGGGPYAGYGPAQGLAPGLVGGAGGMCGMGGCMNGMVWPQAAMMFAKGCGKANNSLGPMY